MTVCEYVVTAYDDRLVKLGTYEPAKRGILREFAHPGVAEWWRAQKSHLADDFQTFVDELSATIRPPPNEALRLTRLSVFPSCLVAFGDGAPLRARYLSAGSQLSARSVRQPRENRIGAVTDGSTESLREMNSFEYLVALVSIIAGLGLTRALSGLARAVHFAGERSVSSVHIAWTGSVLLWLVAFWWFTFLLGSIDTWTPPLLLFVLFYGAVIYFLIALLYPAEPKVDTDSFAYFLENRRWFFGTFVALGVLDLADTWLKYRLTQILPPMVPYSLLMVSWISLGAVGFVSASRIFHQAFGYFWLVVMAVWVTATLFPID